jgi:tetratricopeptide (TPR) repeat protein
MNPASSSDLSLEEAAPLPSRSAIAYNNDGLAMCKAKDFEGAVRAFKCAVKARPDNPEFWNNVGYGYQMLGKYETSNYYCLKALELSPNRTAAFGNIAYNKVKLGYEDEAVAFWVHYLNSFPSDAKRERGISFLRKIAVTDEDPRVGTCIHRVFETLRIIN